MSSEVPGPESPLESLCDPIHLSLDLSLLLGSLQPQGEAFSNELLSCDHLEPAPSSAEPVSYL